MRQFYQIAVMSGLLLAATAFADQDIEVIPAEQDFGIVELGASVKAVIELKNVGDRVLRLDDIQLIQEEGEDFKITSLLYLPVFYGAGGSFYVEVEFTPSKPGKSQATLKVISSDPDEGEVDVPLVGESPSDEMSPADQIAAILEFFDQAVEADELQGVVPQGMRKPQFRRYWVDIHLRTYRHQLLCLQRTIENEWYRWALEQTKALYKKTDGEKWPPDFIEGPAAPELADKLLKLQETLDEMTEDVQRWRQRPHHFCSKR